MAHHVSIAHIAFLAKSCCATGLTITSEARRTELSYKNLQEFLRQNEQNSEARRADANASIRQNKVLSLSVAAVGLGICLTAGS